MPQKIHYRDDIFLLSVLVKSLDSSLSIEADPEYYRDHVISEIFFIDTTIGNLHDVLSRNQHLVDRSEYVKLLERVASSFARAIEALVAGDRPSSGEYSTWFTQLKALASGQRAISHSLRSLLEGGEEGDSFDSDVVSGDEIEKLLSE
jgi:hypothetical protein